MQADIIQDIRKRCRLTMNGIASTSMRQMGMSYKVNFGLLIPQIKELAGSYEKNAELANSIWREDTRELKILATLLYPINEFTEENANKWVAEITNQEIREQVCFNLFQELPYADKLVTEWGRSESEDIRTTGYWLLARLLLLKKTEGVVLGSFPSIMKDAVSENTFLRNAALLALKHIGRQSKAIANEILKDLSVYKEDENLVKQEAYNSLAFEFEYFFED